MFSKIFSLAALARLRFTPLHLEMKACSVFNQLHIFLGHYPWQLPKFTEDMHKIAHNSN